MKLQQYTGHKFSIKRYGTNVLKDQRGFNVVEFLMLVALVLVVVLVVVPNLSLFLGVDRKLAAANVEASNMRFGAMAYEKNHPGKYPSNSDALWTDPPGPGDYTPRPHAFYSFDVGNGRIISASTDLSENNGIAPWSGIKWDNAADSWVKQ
jgi:competence protein ComGC